MKLHLHYFGILAETTNCAKETMELPDNSNTADLQQALLKKYPQLNHQLFRIAVNQKMAQEPTALTDGDEIAALPPFAGG